MADKLLNDLIETLDDKNDDGGTASSTPSQQLPKIQQPPSRLTDQENNETAEDMDIQAFLEDEDEDEQKYEHKQAADALYENEVDLSQSLPQRAKKKRRKDRNKTDEDSGPLSIVRAAKEAKYEYLDHTADIQLHSWGDSLAEAFEQVGVAMFGYMTELDTVEYFRFHEITASGHDLESLLFNYLNELLGAFYTENNLLFKDIEITHMESDKNFTITAIGYGEEMNIFGKHPQGTEVKAITYSAMQIKQTKERCDCWVVVDI